MPRRRGGGGGVPSSCQVSGSSKFLLLSILFPSFIIRIFPPGGRDWLRQWEGAASYWLEEGGWGVSAPPPQSEVGVGYRGGGMRKGENLQNLKVNPLHIRREV